MEFPKELQDALVALLEERFDFSDVTLKSIEIDEDAGELRIVIMVGTEVPPENFARGFFGLPSLVQRKIADRASTLSEFFPVITPEISQPAHA
ncbi:hypothetical protein [Donghicola sp.]|jgi:hypothetical protein|uniref:hypothetical protein n=1 Tax=Donghicola sp. TaxID=1929294 RepID=UPI0025E3AF38|nr:hypothetical protein [Donghicola sp.]MCT4578628.1 hypothetical protein [Donghicola sp.]